MVRFDIASMGDSCLGGGSTLGFSSAGSMVVYHCDHSVDAIG